MWLGCWTLAQERWGADATCTRGGSLRRRRVSGAGWMDGCTEEKRVSHLGGEGEVMPVYVCM